MYMIPIASPCFLWGSVLLSRVTSENSLLAANNKSFSTLLSSGFVHCGFALIKRRVIAFSYHEEQHVYAGEEGLFEAIFGDWLPQLVH